jgi:hypothetical protein
MTLRTSLASLPLLLLVAGTAHAAAGWQLQPVTLPASNDPSAKGIELKADGTVLAPDGKLLARVAGHELHAPDGSVIVRQGSDGSVEGKGLPGKITFGADDELQLGGNKLYFDKAGALFGQKGAEPAKALPGVKLPQLKGHGRQLPLLIYFLYLSLK